eukprot:scaffold302848_cov35-Tisochrysis_lutea.AAC.3
MQQLLPPAQQGGPAVREVARTQRALCVASPSANLHNARPIARPLGCVLTEAENECCSGCSTPPLSFLNIGLNPSYAEKKNAAPGAAPSAVASTPL